MQDNDRLLEILEAAEKRNYLPPLKPSSKKKRFSLISFSTLNSKDFQRIRSFQNWIHDKYRVSIVTIGGGYGCSRIIFEVHASSKDKALELIHGFINDKELQEKAVELTFRVFIVDNPYLRMDLWDGSLQGKIENYHCVIGGNYIVADKIDNSVNINAPLVNSPMLTHSPNGRQSVNINSNLDGLLNTIELTLKSDNSLSGEKLAALMNDMDVMKRELHKETPSKTVVTAILSNLGSIASIASLINEVAPFLPRLF